MQLRIPPGVGYRRAMEPSKSFQSSVSPSVSVPSIHWISSSIPIHASTAPANRASRISLNLAMHGDRKTIFASGYSSFSILPWAIIGETTGAIYGVSSPYSFSIRELTAGQQVVMMFSIFRSSIRLRNAFVTSFAPSAVSRTAVNPRFSRIFTSEPKCGQTDAKLGAALTITVS